MAETDKAPASRKRATTAAVKMAAVTSPARERAPTAQPQGRVTVRHYCQGIGDCHLLRFNKAGGGDFWMLIDCGVHSSISGGAEMIDRVVEDIRKLTEHLDVIVITHEHTDHISGFLSSAKRFGDFTVGELWMAWTESPTDTQAQELDKYKEQALAALQLASGRLAHAQGLDKHLGTIRTGLDSLLDFSFGAKGERVRALRVAAEDLAHGQIKYRQPSDPPFGLSDVPNLRIYVLGPPRDPAFLKLTERASEMYAVGSTDECSVAQAISCGLATSGGGSIERPDLTAPFDPNVGTDLGALLAAASSGRATVHGPSKDRIAEFARDWYFGDTLTPSPVIKSRRPPQRRDRDPKEYDQSWRRIDLDWLGVSADLAMQLDNRTNNTSLVLAFEFSDTGRVMLFAADAQVGNWLSWQQTRWSVDGVDVTGPELLARTVYYKVGHHGSHNATLKAKGLELMTDRDLSAFIPTNEKDAKKVGWGQMPFGAITSELAKRCQGRVVRSDDAWVAAGTSQAPPFPVPSGSLRAVRHEPGLWVEFDIS